MDKIEKIRAEIERLYDGKAPKHDQQCDFDDGYFTGIGVISAFIDTLSEEPDKSLEEAANMMYPPGINDNLRNAFKAGAEWQKSQMLEDGIDCEVKIDAGGYPYIERTIELYDYEKDEPLAKKGDKYKLVLLKVTEDEAGRI